MKFLKNYFWVLLLILPFSFALAASPVAVMDQVSHQMLGALEKNKTHLNSTHVISQIVNRSLIPYVEVNRMASSVVGPNYWRTASASQKQAFISHFKNLVISTYASALASYDDDKVQFSPIRGSVGANATVNSVIIRKTGQRIPISYSLVQSGGTWKIYDFSIENVSMVQSYRAQFADDLAQSGMNGLIKKLAQHNSGNK